MKIGFKKDNDKMNSNKGIVSKNSKYIEKYSKINDNNNIKEEIFRNDNKSKAKIEYKKNKNSNNERKNSICMENILKINMNNKDIDNFN